MSNNDEIDLVYLINKTTSSVKSLINWVVNTTIKKLPIVILLVTIGAGLGVSLFYFKKPIYVSELTVSHIRFNNDQCLDLINNISKISGTPKLITKALQIDEATANEIDFISFEPMNSRLNKIYSDSSNVMFPFKIIVGAYTRDLFEKIESPLMNYLENNPYGLVRKKIKEEQIIQQEQFLITEIQALDTLRGIVNKSIEKKNMGNGIVIDEPIDPVKISVRYLQLKNLKTQYNELKKLNSSFEIMVGFNGGVRKTPNITKSGVYGGFFGYLLALVFLRRKQLTARVS